MGPSPFSVRSPPEEALSRRRAVPRSSRKFCATAWSPRRRACTAGRRAGSAGAPARRRPRALGLLHRPARATPWPPGASAPSGRCRARAARPRHCRRCARARSSPRASSSKALSRSIDSGSSYTRTWSQPLPFSTSSTTRRALFTVAPRSSTDAALRRASRSEAWSVIGEPVDGRQHARPRREDPPHLDGSCVRITSPGFEGGRLRRALGDLDQLVAEQPLGHDLGLGVRADALAERGEPRVSGHPHLAAHLAARAPRR